MGLTAKDKGGKDFEPVAEGLHHAICYAVIDIGTHFNAAFGKWHHQCYIMFELPDIRIEIEGKYLPRAISKKFTVSLHEKAELRKYLTTWRGRAFTEEELQGFDITKLMGVNCFIQIIHAKKNDKTYANIASITPLTKGVQKKELENKPIYFSFEDGMTNIPEGVPGWLVDQIKSAKEWGGQSGAEQQDDVSDDIPF
ncbi:MAG: hypothetical protein HQK77_14270 [Desulfobacterales bacterium]|nr:hypothetical protein [Desulfobacterales bacterium]